MKTVTFESRIDDHKLVRKPEVDQMVVGIGRQVLQQPLRYRFRDRRLIAAEGKDVLQDNMYWLADGEDQGKSRDMVEALKAHRGFGKDFWIEGHGPGTLYPRPQDFRKELMDAIGRLDEERVVEMLAEERASHARVDLVNDAENALGSVRGALKALEERTAGDGQGGEPSASEGDAGGKPAAAKK